MAANVFSTRILRPWPAQRSRLLYTWRLCAFVQNPLRHVSNVASNMMLMEPWSYGTLTITGWIRDASAVPQRRVIELVLVPSMFVVARTESDPTNAGNNYFFNELQPAPGNERYSLQVYNADGSTAARIKDSRVPV